MNTCLHRPRFHRDNRAVSPAISMVIVTAATIVLVLVASNYAYLALNRQQSDSELTAVQKSFIAFDDAVRDVAWNRGATRGARFTATYGFLGLVSNASFGVSVAELSTAVYPPIDKPLLGQTGYLKYNLSTNYLTYSDGYKNQLLGDGSLIVSNSSEDLGNMLISQSGDWINIDLSYRVRVMQQPPINSNGFIIQYVDVLITRLDVAHWQTYSGSFDVVAKNTNVATYSVRWDNPSSQFTLNAHLGDSQESKVFVFDQRPDRVVFNFVVAAVEVTGW